jgi:hypothetical protein
VINQVRDYWDGSTISRAYAEALARWKNGGPFPSAVAEQWGRERGFWSEYRPGYFASVFGALMARGSRFIRHEPLRRVHECVFDVLALESEPVDPRL